MTQFQKKKLVESYEKRLKKLEKDKVESVYKAPTATKRNFSVKRFSVLVTELVVPTKLHGSLYLVHLNLRE